MSDAEGSHQLRAPAVRFVRGPADPAAAERVCLALRDVRRAQQPRLGAERYRPPDGLGLQANLQDAVTAAAPPEELVGQPGTALRSELLRRLAVGVLQQSADFLAGLERAPSRDEWQSVRSVRYLVHGGPLARQAFLAALQAQAIVVVDMGITYRVPVREVVSCMPVDHVQVVVRGLPPDCARQGALGALIGSFGYTADSGFPVVHERAGLAPMPAGFDGVLPCYDTIVGVVATSADDPFLRHLPGQVAGEGWAASVRVETSAAECSPVIVCARTPTHSRPPTLWQPPASAGRLAGLFTAGARGGSMWAPTAEDILAGARPSGVRAGLGFGGSDEQGGLPVGFVAASGAAVAGQSATGVAPRAELPRSVGPPPLEQLPAPPLPPPVAQQQCQPEHDEAVMAQAPPLPQPVPAHQPGFSAAVEHITECTDLSTSDAEAVVLQVRATCPTEYAAVSEVTSPGALDEGFRRAVHAAAVGMFGAEVATPLAVLPRDADLGGQAEVGSRQLAAAGQAARVEAEPARPPPRPHAAAAAAAASLQPPPSLQTAPRGHPQRARNKPGEYWKVNAPSGRAAAGSGRDTA